VKHLISFLRRRASLLLLPLSIAPFVGGIPVIVNSHEKFQREHTMGPLPAPAVALTQAETSRLAAFAAPAKQVPVVAWHGVSPSPGPLSTSPQAFARQLALLKHLGYTTISAQQWADFRAGRGAPLPAKPILLTFDDGRLDSYRGADEVLKRMGMRASMFVSTGPIEDRDPAYLSWSELHRMADSGRWDIQPHAYHGYQKITVSADGTQAPFYAARRYTRSQGREDLAAWEARVSQDLFKVRTSFTTQGMTPSVFAVPYSDYGQASRNDRAIPGLLSGLLERQFGNYFVSDGSDPGYTTPGSGAAQRYVVRGGTTLDQLYGWLHGHAEHRTAARDERRPTSPRPHRKNQR
jgi:peptidoglycan/xylan/chitin deacetylase (PgdA/CDA1 family)